MQMILWLNLFTFSRLTTTEAIHLLKRHVWLESCVAQQSPSSSAFRELLFGTANCMHYYSTQIFLKHSKYFRHQRERAFRSDVA